MIRLVANNAHVRLSRSAPMLGPFDFAPAPGRVTALVGPNGAGKTTVLRLLAGSLSPSDGSVTLDGRPVSALPALRRARSIAYQPQSPAPVWAMRVRDVVATGRLPHGDAAQAPVAAALDRLDLQSFADRPVTALSGGELARVLLARTLAVQAPILLLDEPVAALDIGVRERVMAVLVEEAGRGAAVVLSLHDLALACAWADELALVANGRMVGVVPPRLDALPLVRQTFGVAVTAGADPAGRLTNLGVQPERKL